MPKGHPASWQRVLLRELQQVAGLELHIFAIRKTFSQTSVFKSQNATFYCIKAPKRLRAPSLFWADNYLLSGFMKRLKPDVIHAWGMEQAAGLVASRFGIPYVISMQGVFSWLQERVKLNLYERFMGLLERWVLPTAPKVTVEASFAVRYLRQRWPQIEVEQIEHAPDPIFASTPRANMEGKLRFLSMGGINELKGADLVFDCLSSLSHRLSFELVCIGNHNTELLGVLRSRVSESFFSSICFKSDLSPSEVAHEMAGATMLLYPTRGDTSPNAVKEAVVHGLPVVASRVGGIPDYVIDSENGVLFEAGDAKEFENAVEVALRHPLFSKGIVSQERLEVSREMLSAKTMARKFLHCYDSIKRC